MHMASIVPQSSLNFVPIRRTTMPMLLLDLMDHHQQSSSMAHPASWNVWMIVMEKDAAQRLTRSSRSTITQRMTVMFTEYDIDPQSC